MQKIIPTYYTGYGRYITKLRSFPYYIDALKPVERRCLLGLYEQAKNKFVKSAKVTGLVMGNYHPHGDSSIYGCIANTLIPNGYAEGEGNWGSYGLENSNPAAQRYTECRLSNWVKELAFKYIDHVPWVNIEYEDEPLALPSPIPLGLIGLDVIFGIAFSRTLVPKYSLKDLAKRMIWLLENGKIQNFDESNLLNYGPMIKPNFRNCVSKAPDAEYYKILVTGFGSIDVTPFGKIDKGNIYINGCVPGATFNSLQRACMVDENTKIRKIQCDILDNSGNPTDPYYINIILEPLKKNSNINAIAQDIWENYLTKTLNFTSYYSDEVGKTSELGIDDILMTNYEFWQNAVLTKRRKDYNKCIENKFENDIVMLIRYLNESCNATSTQILLDTFHNLYPNGVSIPVQQLDKEKNSTINVNRNITDDMIIDICKKKSIRQLIETQIDSNAMQQAIIDTLNRVNSLTVDCFNIVKSLI